MRRLVPDVADLELGELYDDLVLCDGVGEAGARRAWIALGVVTSLDGAASVEGTSGRLGGDADRVAFQQLRSACDAILVGAGTVRAEAYRPPVGSDRRRAERRRRGLTEIPLLVVVSRSLTLPPDHPIFGDERCRPIVVTSASAPQADADALEEVAEVVRLGAGEHVDVGELARWLAGRALPRVVCEGGPRLAGALLERDLIDEVFVTLAPTLVGGSGPRVVQHGQEVVRDLRLTSAYEHAGDLVLRYRRADGRFQGDDLDRAER